MTTPVLRSRTHATTSKSGARPVRGAHTGLGRRHGPKSLPIVAGIEASDVSLRAASEAARLAGDLGAPLIFVYVRDRPWAGLGVPYFQRRLNAEMAKARKALGAALAAAGDEGVIAEAEILEGAPARRVVEFARHRNARLVVLGSRRRRIRSSVSRRVIQASDRPVVVAGI